MCTLTANRQTSAVTKTTVVTHIHQTLDVLGDFTAQITFNLMLSINCLTNLQHFLIGQVVNTAVTFNADFLTDFGGLRRTDAISTRLLVGIFTPAIRATLGLHFNPVPV